VTSQPDDREKHRARIVIGESCLDLTDMDLIGNPRLRDNDTAALSCVSLAR